MVWDDYGKSFHLFNGFGFGDSQDEISPSSGYTVIEFENGDYFLGEMFDGAPTHGLYYTESNGDFYLGGYKYMVEESAESGVLPVFSWEEDEVMMLMKKTDNVIEVSDYFAYSIRNFKITEDDLENFFVLGQPVSETESPMPNSAAPSQDPNDRPGEANPPAPTKTPESTTKTCQDCGGSGRVFCTDCDGSGYISFAVGSDQQKMTCFGCDGTGKRVCYSCDGTGKISESPSQGGSEAPYVPDYDPPQAPDASGGRTTCVMCNGSGKRTCTTCGGSGTLSQNKVGIDGSYYVDVTCTLCDGTGRMICSGCYGKGSY